MPIGSLLNVFLAWHHNGSAIIERKKEPATHQPKPVSAYQRYYIQLGTGCTCIKLLDSAQWCYDEVLEITLGTQYRVREGSVL